MQKLIELLNEYIEENKPKTNLVKEITDGGYFVNNWNDWDWFLCETIMSKRFWFIKWLVENEKIDFSWEWNLSSELVNLFERKLDNAEWVIALLSIQDEPIEFLCSILK